MPLVAALLLVLLVPSSAAAATVEMRALRIDEGDRYYPATAEVAVTVVDDRGEPNDLTLSTDGVVVVVRDDAADLVAGDGCAQRDARTVACSAPRPPTVGGRLLLGAGDDVVRSRAEAFFVDGGPGDDDLRGGVVRGGPGGDVLRGGADYSERSAPVTADADGVADDGAPGEGDDVRPDAWGITGGAGDDVLGGGPVRGQRDSTYFSLSGGGGDDVLTGGAQDDTLDGGPGADRMAGGPGADTVTYEMRPVPVRVTKNGQPGDGARGEGDDVGGDVERVLGGMGDDVLIGGPSADELRGGGGDDVLRGGAGDDVLWGALREQGERNVIDGGAGRDQLSGGDRDRIDARDGEPDEIFCGTGREGFLGILRGDPREERTESCAPDAEVFGVADRRVVERDGVVRLRLRCPRRSPIACVGGVYLFGGPGPLRDLARATFRLAPGAARTVALRMTPVGRRLLRRHGPMRAGVSGTTRRFRPWSIGHVDGRPVRLVRGR